MRVTNRMMTDAVNANLFKQSERLMGLEETASSGKKIVRPSDDPVAAGRIMGYRAELSAADQSLTNITHAKTRIELTENVLETMDGFLKTLWGYVGDTGSLTPEERSVAAGDIKTLKEQIRDLANTKHDGRYLFAGHLTDEMPFPGDNTYAGDAGEIPVMIGNGMEMNINTTGDALFPVGPDGRVALFETLDALEAAYGDAPFDPSAVTDEMAADVKAAIDGVKEARAEGSARIGRLGSAWDFLESIRPKLAAMLAAAEEADMTEAIVEMKLQETAYQTALNTAARVIQPTLLDFLK